MNFLMANKIVGFVLALALVAVVSAVNTNVKGTAQECHAADACFQGAVASYVCAISNGEKAPKGVTACATVSATDCATICPTRATDLKVMGENAGLTIDKMLYACFDEPELQVALSTCAHAAQASKASVLRSVYHTALLPLVAIVIGVGGL